ISLFKDLPQRRHLPHKQSSLQAATQRAPLSASSRQPSTAIEATCGAVSNSIYTSE
ncbi:hypothetical protein CTAM01_13544, partial [Colletotrichum tamarilloi]